MAGDRFARNERFFGQAGQRRLRSTTCAIVGVGGLGTHVVQQLALLGVGGLHLIDPEVVEESNRNRYIGFYHQDPVGMKKTEVGARLAKSIDPGIRVDTVFASFVSVEGFEAVRNADFVFGCLDTEGIRLVLNELCLAYSRPYADLATEIIPGAPLRYGGRVCVVDGGEGCLSCLGLLDVREAGQDLTSEADSEYQGLYGLDQEQLHRSGPSVVSLNGIIASHGVTEFMLSITGVRAPRRLLRYYGSRGKVVLSTDAPEPDCWYCKIVHGQGAAAGVERYCSS